MGKWQPPSAVPPDEVEEPEELPVELALDEEPALDEELELTLLEHMLSPEVLPVATQHPCSHETSSPAQHGNKPMQSLAWVHWYGPPPQPPLELVPDELLLELELVVRAPEADELSVVVDGLPIEVEETPPVAARPAVPCSVPVVPVIPAAPALMELEDRDIEEAVPLTAAPPVVADAGLPASPSAPVGARKQPAVIQARPEKTITAVHREL